MTQQSAFDLTETEPPAWELVYDAAKAAVDLTTRPGFADFTAGPSAVTVEHTDGERIVLTTDNRWAASAIRTALHRSGAAVEADRSNETTTVTVWAINQGDGTTSAEARFTEERDEHGRTILLLDGPAGAVEQQCGSGGHNNLIVHAHHPFPSSARTDCPRHGEGCWIRSDWPYSQWTARSYVKSVVTETGYAWKVGPEAKARMYDIYLRHVHRTNPGAKAPTFRLQTAQPIHPGTQTEAIPTPSEAGPMTSPRVVDVIRDVADCTPACAYSTVASNRRPGATTAPGPPEGPQ